MHQEFPLSSSHPGTFKVRSARALFFSRLTCHQRHTPVLLTLHCTPAWTRQRVDTKDVCLQAGCCSPPRRSDGRGRAQGELQDLRAEQLLQVSLRIPVFWPILCVCVRVSKSMYIGVVLKAMPKARARQDTLRAPAQHRQSQRVHPVRRALQQRHRGLLQAGTDGSEGQSVQAAREREEPTPS